MILPSNWVNPNPDITVHDTLKVPLRRTTDGEILVGEIGVPLNDIVRLYKDTGTSAQIIKQYPALELADIYAVIAYYLLNTAEIEEYLG